MLLQTLVSILIVVLLSGALLTGTLISAKVALHEAATRHVQIALAGGTGDLERWAADYVYRNHASAQWPTSLQTTAPQPICHSIQVIDATTQASCSLFETTTYRVTGSTTEPTAGNEAGSSTLATADNLQTAVDEQRISAEVTATITNATGTVLGTGTRELTVRVFDVPPWAIVTGARDVTTVIGSVHAAEGDTAGVDANGAPSDSYNATPDPVNPSQYKNTVIYAKMTCTNSVANGDQGNPKIDNQPPGNNDMPWGVQAIGRAFEAPCQPNYGLAETPAIPAGAEIPRDANYDVGALSGPRHWLNGGATSGASWSQ